MVQAEVLSLAGRVAIVTGSGRGIGAAIARLYSRAGAHLALLDTDGATVSRTAEEIALAGGEALSFTADVTDAFAIERVFDQIAEEWGRLDILVNNAGIVLDATLTDVTDEDWAQTLDVNLRGAMVCARAAVPHMLKHGYGRIVSATSLVARNGNYGQTAYAASKAGLIGLTRTWARELGPKGITANCVAPGFIDTDMTRALAEQQRVALLAHIPLGRLGQPEDIAAAVAYLASPAAGYVTGAVLHVNGGMYLA
jgi:3-oxoacyl-[acyl-carrier protein] reductase